MADRGAVIDLQDLIALDGQPACRDDFRLLQNSRIAKEVAMATDRG